MENTDLTKKKKKWTLENIKNLLSYINMLNEILTFDDIEFEKNKFYCHKIPIF